MTAKLVLENGLVFEGRSFGADAELFGEVVFNTSLTGYQEIVTDPSYRGQIVTMTNPLIGNYGINDDDMESSRPQVAETSALGAAVLAAAGLGLHADVGTAVRAMAQPGRVTPPDPAAARVYDTLYQEVYRPLYRRLRPLYARLRTLTGYPP